jgi:hypothetical protein
MIKSGKIWRFEIIRAYSDPHTFYFCVAKNIKYLKLIFCTFVDKPLSTSRFFIIFSETHKYDFRKFYNDKITGACLEPKISTTKAKNKG